MEFEDEFDLDIPENEEAIRTVGDAVKYIQGQLDKKKQG
jgi:acyl carrier protein